MPFDQMKQKRKVKSLLPHKKGNRSLLITFLIVLWLALCLWSVSLWTMSSVWAEVSYQTITGFQYNWIENKRESVYRVEFVDSGDLNKIANEMYMTKESLYIVPRPVIVNSGGSENEVKQYTYGHVLWWKGNEVKSNNVTLIAWKNNKVVEYNKNATVLWWIGNEFGYAGWMWNPRFPIVVVWWSGNKVWEEHNGVALIWWEGNVIGGLESDIFVLWWTGNEVWTGSTDVIVWWKLVKIPVNKRNIFAYSNYREAFSPKTDNAFYLKLQKWVWFNAKNNDEWLSVWGAISFWEININNETCDESNYGVVWSYEWCLVWCTKAWKESGGKWELLDRWENCKEVCNSNNDKCLTKSDEETLENKPYTRAECTNLSDYTGNSYLCNTGVFEKYRNVVFESVLIDSDTQCPGGENMCVFKCNPGYHLVEDETGKMSGKKKCYRDCELPWNPSEKIKHGGTVMWYNEEKVYCSNDDYSFPTDNIGGAWWPIFKPGIYPGVYWAYQSCTNYNHMKKLVCVDGTLYLTEGDNKKATNLKALENGYTEGSCMLYDYSCKTGDYEYNLSADDVRRGKYNVWYGENSIVLSETDRAKSYWTRWNYETCVDWNPTPGNPQVNGEECNEVDRHYKLLECKAGFATGDDYPFECRGMCNFGGSQYKDGESVTGYKNDRVRCTDVCEAAKLTCNDGHWEWWIDTYSHSNCELSPKECWVQGYQVSSSVYMEHNNIDWTKDQYSIYDSCQEYNAEWQFQCNLGDMKYKLVGCVDGYHTENNEYCISNIDKKGCTKPDHSHWLKTWDNIDRDTNIWEWCCWWNYWWWYQTQYCEWECNYEQGYYPDGGSCKKDGKCSRELNKCDDGSEATNTRHDEGIYRWTCPWDGWKSDECFKCDDGRSEVSDKKICEKDEDAQCGIEKYTCTPWNPVSKWQYPQFSSNPIKYTWDCEWLGKWESATGCIKCIEPYVRLWSTNECFQPRCIWPEWPDLETADRNDSTPANEDKEWYYQESGELWPCEWRCKEWYQRDGNSMRCVQILAECWSASWSVFSDTPTTDLCDYWSELEGESELEDRYEWECKRWENIVKCTATKVACGIASGGAYKEIPDEDLCNSWSKASEVRTWKVDNVVKWMWNCYTWDVKVEDCSADYVSTSIVCGEAIKNHYQTGSDIDINKLCPSSDYESSDITYEEANNRWVWTCKLEGAGVKCVAKVNQCIGGVEPLTTSKTAIISKEIPREHGTQWQYVENINEWELGPCQWSCPEGYNRNWGTCMRKRFYIKYHINNPSAICSWWDWSDGERFGVLYGSSHVVREGPLCEGWMFVSWIDMEDNDTRYTPGSKIEGVTRDYELKGEWKEPEHDLSCPEEYDMSTKGKCYYDDWTSIDLSDDFVSYENKNHRYTWECDGTPCYVCDVENGYVDYDEDHLEWKCEKRACNYCAKNGFPYCFPLDFSEDCEEPGSKYYCMKVNGRYYGKNGDVVSKDTYEEQCGDPDPHYQLIDGTPTQNQSPKCRVDTSKDWCTAYSDAQMEEFTDIKSCEDQPNYWMCKPEIGEPLTCRRSNDSGYPTKYSCSIWK